MRQPHRLGWTALVVTALLCVLAAPPASGSAPLFEPARRPRIVLSSHRVMVDEPVGITVVGLQPRIPVQMHLTLVAGGYTWVSHATFLANRSGKVDPAATGTRRRHLLGTGRDGPLLVGQACVHDVEDCRAPTAVE